MGRKRISLGLLILQMLVLGLALFGPNEVAQAGAYNPGWSFLQVWERGDYPVALGAVRRSWYWGPAPFANLKEGYADTPGGQREVAYYDKGRMEITNPLIDRASRWYISRGLLVRELVEGQLQLGDHQFSPFAPAEVPVSGDGPTQNELSPTYARFHNLTGSAPRSNTPSSTTLDRSGKISDDPGLALRYPETTPAYYDTTLGHNIPGPFWRFMNLQGPITVDHRLVNGPIEDWLSGFGLPITEAYWTRSKVAGVEKDVLVQLFERRSLTYTPSNDPAYQIEMGNVGRHYFSWRYPDEKTRPALVASFSQPAIRLEIPAIGVDTVIEYVGQKEDTSMDVPHDPHNVAWYRYGAFIGGKGNAVLAGHLDWYNIGPTVFYNLRKLKPGDMVYVYTTLGTRHSFQVYEAASYPLNDYPQERIFGDSDKSNLNLITCSGSFDPSSASYNKRLIVYTTLVG